MGCACHNGTKYVTLIDGRKVCSCSREWMHECEARTILAMQPLSARRERLAAIEEKRGWTARKDLEDTMTKIHQAHRRPRA